MGMLEFLTGRSREVLDSINGIRLSLDDIIKFGDVVHDYSRPHRSIEEARKLGFEDTPIIGVHLAAIGGRLSRDLMSTIQKSDEDFFYVKQDVTFRDPIYPGTPINWNPPEIKFDDGRIAYNLVIPHQDPQKKPRVEMVSEFRTSRPEFQRPRIEELVYLKEIEFVSKEVKIFYKCLREEPKETITFSHGSAIIPSVLLSFAERLNEIQGTDVGGKNVEMFSQAYDELELGKAKVEIYFVEKRGRGARSSYTFDGVLYQNNKPIISSRVKSFTHGEFDVYALREKFFNSESSSQHAA